MNLNFYQIEQFFYTAIPQLNKKIIQKKPDIVRLKVLKLKTTDQVRRFHRSHHVAYQTLSLGRQKNRQSYQWSKL